MTSQSELFAPKPEPTGQCATVLDWLRGHPEGLTHYEAMTVLGVGRLAARVAELRADGYRVYSVTETRDGKRWARYVLKTNEVGT